MTLAVSFTALLKGALYAALVGIFFGVVYDGVRLSRMLLGIHYKGNFFEGFFARRAKKTEAKIEKYKESHLAYRCFLKGYVFFSDILFFLFVGVVYSIFLYVVNHGIFRFVFLLATILGFGAYRKTVGRIVFFGLRELSSVFTFLSFFVIKFFVLPLKNVFSWIFSKTFGQIVLLLRKLCAIIMVKRKKIQKSVDKEDGGAPVRSSFLEMPRTPGAPIRVSVPRKRNGEQNGYPSMRQ